LGAGATISSIDDSLPEGVGGMAVRLSDGDVVRAAGGQWVGTEGGAERKEEEGGQEAQDGWLTTVEEGQRVVKLTTHGGPTIP
jgi:hypothetical protein